MTIVTHIPTTRSARSTWKFDQQVPGLEQMDEPDTERLAKLIHRHLVQAVGKQVTLLLHDEHFYTSERRIKNWQTAREFMLAAEKALMRHNVTSMAERLHKDTSFHVEIPCGTMPIIVSGLLYTP